MNSTTGDFTELRRSTVELDINRISQSLVKRRPRVPRKIVNITPLNWDEIRKELEEGDNEEKVISDEVDNANVKSSQSLKSDACFRDATNRNEVETSDIPARKTDLIEIDKENTPLGCVVNEKDKIIENNATPAEVSFKQKENDSFDLNFSALSLVTPVKKVEPSSITPKIQKFGTNNTNSVVKFNDFVTPRDKIIPMKCQNSALKSSVGSVRRGLLNNMINTPLIEERNEEICENEEQNKFLPEIYLFERLWVKNVEYLVMNKLGKGGSSEVFACFCPENKRHVAIKCVSLENQVNAVGYINEVKLLQRLQNCEKIIKMYDFQVVDSEKKLLVVLERGGEDLSTILKNIAVQKTHIPFYMLFFYWMEMLYAVKQIHDHGVIHSDLKPANFLRAESGLKLIDFGIASSVQMDMTSVFKTTPEGSCNYISPEALNQETSANPSSPSNNSAKYKIHFKSDVWSLGCILYQLVYRRTPFQHLNNLWKKLAYIINPNHVIEFPDANWVPPKIINTIKKCLQYDVKCRPSINELINEYENFWCQNCFSLSPSTTKEK